MKFKEFIHKQSIITEKIIVEELLTDVNEASQILNKLKTLSFVSNEIHNLDILDILTEIKSFLKTQLTHMKITDISSWSKEIIHSLEVEIKSLLKIKTSIKTDYVDSLIVQAKKLIETVKKYAEVKKEEYDSTMN